MDSNIQYNKLIEENLEKGYQVRLVINDFRETTYIQLRKYFLSYEGEWIPSREGVSIPASTENIYAILDGLFDICSKAEGHEIIKHYYNKISWLKAEFILILDLVNTIYKYTKNLFQLHSLKIRFGILSHMVVNILKFTVGLERTIYKIYLIY